MAIAEGDEIDLGFENNREEGTTVKYCSHIAGQDYKFFQILTTYGVDQCIVGFEVLTAVVIKSTIFWDITPCSPLGVNRRFGGTSRLHLQHRRTSRARARFCFPPAFAMVSCSAYSSTLKMEAIISSETLVDTQRTTRRYITEDGTLHQCIGFYKLPGLPVQ
jgi:hypothetical protein